MTSDPITIQSVLKHTELLSTDTEAATFFMNLESGQYLMLESTGRRIWQLIDGESRVIDIIDKLVLEYETDRASCSADTLLFLEDLRSHGAVDVVS